MHNHRHHPPSQPAWSPWSPWSPWWWFVVVVTVVDTPINRMSYSPEDCHICIILSTTLPPPPPRCLWLLLRIVMLPCYTIHAANCESVSQSSHQAAHQIPLDLSTCVAANCKQTVQANVHTERNYRRRRGHIRWRLSPFKRHTQSRFSPRVSLAIINLQCAM